MFAEGVALRYAGRYPACPSSWQRRCWERSVRDEDHLRRYIDYSHISPRRNGYVERVTDWPHSPFHLCAKAKMLPKDRVGVIRKAG